MKYIREHIIDMSLCKQFVENDCFNILNAQTKVIYNFLEMVAYLRKGGLNI